MEKILGLDLGVASIGWSLIERDNASSSIIAMGTRVVPLTTDDADEFSKGNAITKNQKRTQRRTARKGLDRFQLRRKYLTDALTKIGMMPSLVLMHGEQHRVWELRSRGVSERLSKPELGRVLYHMLHKRGYRSGRSEANKDKKETEHVAGILSNAQRLHESNRTIGQYMHEELVTNPHFMVKNTIFPRNVYAEEFDAIIKQQQLHYPEVLTHDVVLNLRDRILFYQRKLKSQKGLVGRCELENHTVAKTVNGIERTFDSGPRVAPRSSPLAQLTAIWEAVNNLSIRDASNNAYTFTLEDKQNIVVELNAGDVSETELLKILKLKKSDGWRGNKSIAKGIRGNDTRRQLGKILGFDHPALRFDLQFLSLNVDAHTFDHGSGEIRETKPGAQVDPAFENEPLYRLWHIVYSMPDDDECKNALRNFKINGEPWPIEGQQAQDMAELDLKHPGFANKSSRSMRKILPYLMQGYGYSDACELAGYNHSAWQTVHENAQRTLLPKLALLRKGSLRQPVVEKILNQMIHIVNDIIDPERGWVTTEDRENGLFTVHIELARELRQSQEERNKTYKSNSKRDRENKSIAERIGSEYASKGIRPTRRNIVKWRMFQEISNEESKLNAQCIYCGQPFSLTAAMSGAEVDVEHIIPRTLLFDDSQGNKTLAHRTCNAKKENRTAWDYMESLGDAKLQAYIERVNNLHKNDIISSYKRDRLLMPSSKIPTDFINRQLGETRYISRKAKEILSDITRDVVATSGAITGYLREKWGWGNVTMSLNLARFRAAGLTETREEVHHDGTVHQHEYIKDWSKRNDHRHHAIDALVVACTTRSLIQQINTLAAKETSISLFGKSEFESERRALLEGYLVGQRPFNTSQVRDAVSRILVSFKAGKKVATKGTRRVHRDGKTSVAQTGIIVPRGPLHEESVYGSITGIEKRRSVKEMFAEPHRIYKPYIRDLVQARIAQFDGDYKTALKSLKTDPIYLDKEKSAVLEYGTMTSNEVVIKYPITSVKAKDVPYIVDHGVREIVRSRLEAFGNDEKKAFAELDENPVWFNEEKNIKIRSVRMYTGLSSAESVRRTDDGRPLDFVKPGNNHHIALYKDSEGKVHIHACTFWHAVERKRRGLPVVITDTRTVWNEVLNSESQDEAFQCKLPPDGLTLELSFQQNEMFLLGIDPAERSRTLEDGRSDALSEYLYRVQKLSGGDGELYLVFRHHVETELVDSGEAINARRFVRIQSTKALYAANPLKVSISRVGTIDIAK